MPSRDRVDLGLSVWFAVTAGVFALLATFTRIDDVALGQTIWGIFLVVLAVGHSVVLWRAGWPRGWWPWWFGHSGSALVIGSISFLLAPAGAVALMLWSIAVWAVLAGASSVLHALRHDRETVGRSDWLVVGGATLLLGLATLVEPVDVLWLVGSAGAWAAILAVFTGISAVHHATTEVPQGSEEGD